MEIGIRELRNGLSAFLEQVQAGESIVVTDRGTPVARLVPYEGQSKLERLIEEGLVQPARNPKRRELPPLIPTNGSVSDLVIEQRR